MYFFVEANYLYYFYVYSLSLGVRGPKLQAALW